jgi:SAM-dependent methyltransferase
MEREVYEFHKDVQFRHWWFNGRRRIIAAFLENYRQPQPIRILDIGSGFGSTIAILKNHGVVDVIEPFREAQATLKSLGAADIFDIDDFPVSFPDRRYDWVTMFDVLEHIEDDRQALRVICEELLNPGGRFITTVPAYMWLWTKHDVANHHYRRYHRRPLINLLRQAGFDDIRMSYYMTFLFPLAILERAFMKFNKSDNADLKIPGAIINKILEGIFSSERAFVSRFNFPFGLSLIGSARRPL